MCAIAGIVGVGQPLDVSRERENLAVMLDEMEHRGPDGRRVYEDADRLLLGFCRLSIIDVEHGHQPLYDESGDIVVVANGEIYNHRDLRAAIGSRHTFRSGSDCEVLPHLYEEHGDRFLDQVNGMFGIALWDRRARRLVLARDRLGVKPMHYYHCGDKLLFASEIKGLIAHPDGPREVDWDHALRMLFRRWKDHPASRVRTVFKGVESLPGGFLLEVTADGRLTERPYWQLSQTSEMLADADTITGADCVDRYRSLLSESVRLQLASDVDVGLFLSAGVDSTTIAYLAAPIRPIFTFSIATPIQAETGDMLGAAEIARELGLPHEQAVAEDGHELSIDDWRALLWTVEAPICNTEVYYKYRLHQLARAHHPELKVMLLGQGSDEFSGGYGQWWYQRQSRTAEPFSWDGFYAAVRRCQTQALALRGDPELMDLCTRYPYPILSRDFLASHGQQSYEQDLWFYYQNMWRLNLQFYNLWHEDRTAAAASIENRVPFLDHRIVEFLAAVPERLRDELFRDKQILRRAMEGVVPPRFKDRPKLGFSLQARETSSAVTRLLADGSSLLGAAVESSPSARHIFDIDGLRASAAAVGQRLEDAEYLMVIANLCFLDGLARDAGRSARSGRVPIPPRLTSDQIVPQLRAWGY